jgi:hypothetical protein
MIKLCFYVPKSHVDEVKRAVFATGAGRIGKYDCCCWQTLGHGEFRPMNGSDPFVGQQGIAEIVEEYKVELVCEDNLLQAAVAALKEAHPYEEPAYQAWNLLDAS